MRSLDLSPNQNWILSCFLSQNSSQFFFHCIATQTLRLSDDAVLLLDGAHTRESMLECVNWYKTASKELDLQGQSHGRQQAFKVVNEQVRVMSDDSIYKLENMTFLGELEGIESIWRIILFVKRLLTHESFLSDSCHQSFQQGELRLKVANLMTPLLRDSWGHLWICRPL